MHIRAQNAGVIIRHVEEEVQFELFEASLQNDSIITCQGRVTCFYPGPVLSVPLDRAKDGKFIEQLALLLSSMSSSEIQDAIPKSTKAGEKVAEVRETAEPRYITEFLGEILRASGGQATPLRSISKRIRDDVCWKSSYLPWRRSPLWLVTRVALQSTLSQSNEYKLLMLEFMAEICSLALKANVESDTLCIMIKKLSRRAHKMGDDKMSRSTLAKVQRIVELINEELKLRWNRIQASSKQPIVWNSSVASDSDTCISLARSGAYIQTRLESFNNRIAPNPEKFDTKTRRRFTSILEFTAADDPFYGDSEFDRLVAIIDFEDCVRASVKNGGLFGELSGPVFGRLHIVRKLSTLFEAYAKVAPTLYGKNQECTSVFILTVMELWCELDTLVCEEIELLKDYSPELRVELFEPLFLSKYSDMERIHEVEQHIARREARRLSHRPRILSDENISECFAVKYYNQSRRLQVLHEAIKNDAERERRLKIKELESLKQQYRELMDVYYKKDCKGYYNDRGRYIHRWCESCTSRNKANNLSMKTHEWPLPDDPDQSKRVIFEVAPPEEFAIWRRITYQILMDVFQTDRANADRTESHGSMDKFPELKSRLEARQRISLASTTKSWQASHYSVRIYDHTSEDEVVSRCAMNYRIFDRTHEEWAAGRFDGATIAPLCTIQVLNPPYHKFEYAVNGTRHTSNQVIAKQSHCPIELTLEEYDSFCTLRSGSRLQWLNILRELGTGVLSFKTNEVHDLLRAAACQIGSACAEQPLRDDHLDLGDVEFQKKLLEVMNKYLDTIENNWQEYVVVKTLILLANRVLSTALASEAICSSLEFLSYSRKVTLKWTRIVVERLQGVDPTMDTRRERELIIQMAGICRMTFDVEAQYKARVLKDNLPTYLECGLYIYDNSSNVYSDCPMEIKTVLMRDARCAVQLESFIHSLLRKNSQGLNDCVRYLWDTFEAATQWEQLSEPNGRWYTTRTVAPAGRISQVVHFNILENRLLVDGLPFGRLPVEIFTHRTYRRILGKKILDIFPSNEKGMTYQTKKDVSGLNLHFTTNGKELYIWAISRRDQKNGELVYHELIPYEIIDEDFPRPLSKDSCHWLNLGTGEIEFRSLKNWSELDTGNFVLSSQDGVRHLSNEFEILFDIQGKTVKKMARSLEGLEGLMEMVITRAKQDGTIRVKLPRYKLDFICTKGSDDIVCKTIPDHVVDTDQSIGAFIGLRSMLVLRHNVDPDFNSPRLVLVPRGMASPVQTSTSRTHPKIVITNKGEERAYYQYRVDTKLCRVLDNGTAADRYMRIHLHALTSHCLPDPLTQRTGTAEALDLLRSEGSFSLKQLKETEFQILARIASLTPKREFYPKWKRSMQKIKYDKDLPTLSQHDEFHPAVESILKHWKALQPYCGSTAWSIKLKSPEPELRRRAALRNRHLWAGDITAEAASLQLSCDEVYEARHWPTKDKSVFEIASLVLEWSDHLDVQVDLASLFSTKKLEEDGLKRHSEEAYQKLSYAEEWLATPVNELWLNLYERCRSATRANNTYGLLFVLASLQYGAKQPISLVKTLLAFATNPAFKETRFSLLQHDFYPLGRGSVVDRIKLKTSIRHHFIDFECSEEFSLTASYRESDMALWNRRRNRFDDACSSEASEMAQYFKAQWPCSDPSPPLTSQFPHIKIQETLQEVKELFRCWSTNKSFFDHLAIVSNELRSICFPNTIVPEFRKPVQRVRDTLLALRSNCSSMHQLHLRAPPNILELPDQLRRVDCVNAEGQMSDSTELSNLLERVEEKSGEFSRQYVADMRASLAALREKGPSMMPSTIQHTLHDVKVYHRRSSAAVDYMFCSLQARLAPKSNCEGLLQSSGLWPDVTPLTILQHLQLKKREELPMQWKAAILRFGEILTLNQKAERLLRSYRANNVAEFYQDLDNDGRQNWSTRWYPDWLLIEIESDLLVRQVQASIALEMMKPSCDKNAVMQLNMGEGKSSVILPCVSAGLADGTRLVRNLVLKPQRDQMFNTLKIKLSGLVNRRIYYLPFSRDLNPTSESIAQIKSIFEDCKENGGILLSLPEHLLSMKLMGIDKITSVEKIAESLKETPESINEAARQANETAQRLIKLQRWVDKNARDVLDESDEILNVRYQLIYTVGTQQLPEGDADRWTIVQEALELFRQRAKEYKELNPQAVDISHENDFGAFPTIRILNDDAGKEIIDAVGKDILNGCLASVSSQILVISDLLHDPDLVRSFVTNIDIPQEASVQIANVCAESIFMLHLRLLRGLIAHGILLFIFREKRLHVDYGIDPCRKNQRNYNLAVPYRAKDVPAHRAEFGHMDVLLITTYLSYYEDGLSSDEIRLCFDLLYKTDNPEQIYEDWVVICPSAKTSLRKLHGVNLEDQVQFENDVCQILHRNRRVINFYLSMFVFPKEVKEFPERISANGWDIAQEKPNNKDRFRFMTGFSGTNDNRYLLPTSVQQQDKKKLMYTNAVVLQHVLKPENNTVIHAHHEGQRLSAKPLLKLLVKQQPQTKVLLDLGAQVLELDNRQLVHEWLNLEKDENIQGGIFFKDDELTILKRDGSTEPFRSSTTMAAQMSRYLVYLDEAHTRGTDLKLPLGSRAVVTLGPKLVKDKFVQGCMRMRKLANGHSLVFFAPPEVYNAIINKAGKTQGDNLETKDVLLETMLESCKQIEYNFPNWATQGLSYDNRRCGWNRYLEQADIKQARDVIVDEEHDSLDGNETADIKTLSGAVVEKEHRSLDDMYGPKYYQTGRIINGALEDQTEMVQEIVRTCEKFGITSLRNVSAEEEQEREVEQEKEQERQIERPPEKLPARHSRHHDIRTFVRTGRVPRGSDAVEPAFNLFHRTSVRNSCHIEAWSRNLLASRDFMTTVQSTTIENMDYYIRPVRWILTSRTDPDGLLLISPYEANALIRDVQKSGQLQLRMYNPRISRTPLLDFQNLDVYVTPKTEVSVLPETSSLLTMQLNLFAGQTYLSDHETYESLCEFLGLYFGNLPANENRVKRSMDGFLSRDSRDTLRMVEQNTLVFSSSPIKFIEALMSMRRKGLGFASSHMGGIVHSRRLLKNDF